MKIDNLSLEHSTQSGQKNNTNIASLLEETVNFIIRTHALPSERFLPELAEYLGQLLEADAVWVGRLLPNDTAVSTAVYWVQGKIQSNFTYKLEHTPCANIIGHEFCLSTNHTAPLFTQDPHLSQLNSVTYAGYPLVDLHQMPLGLLAVAWQKPVPQPDIIRPLLKIVSLRTANLLTARKHQDFLYFQRELILTLANSQTLAEAYATMLAQLQNETEVDSGALYLWQAEQAVFQRQAQQIFDPQSDKEWDETESPLPAILTADEAVLKPVYNDTPEFNQKYINLATVDVLAQGVLPIIHKHEPVALLYFASHRQARWGSGTRYLLESTAAHIGSTIMRLQADTKLRQLETSLQQRNARLQQLNDVWLSLSQSLDVDDVKAMLVEEAQTLLKVTAVSLWLFPEGRGEQPYLTCVQATLKIAPALLGKQIYKYQGLTGKAWSSKQEQLTQKFAARVDTTDEQRWLRSFSFQAALAIPLVINQQVTGVLTFFDECSTYFQPERRQLAHALAGMAATALENAHLHQSVQQQLETNRTTQQRLIQNEKLAALGELIAGVAHELNNPLASIILHTELVARQQQDTPLADRLQRIQQDAHRAANIVRHLLDFARQRPPERQVVQINELVQDTLELMSYNLRTRNIEVKTKLQAQLPRIMADPHQLQQVLVNLITNAQQAMHNQVESGLLTITTRLVGQGAQARVEIGVGDNGIGMPLALQARIFDPFFTTKEVGEGTGLGLSVVHGIVTEHGGEIEIHSEIDKGALFLITLPVETNTAVSPSSALAPTLEANAPSDEDEPDLASTPNWRILVLDDEANLRHIVSNILELKGYEVTAVGNGRLGLEKLRAQPYDLILCDINMPDVSGRDFYNALTGELQPYQQRILFITGDTLHHETRHFLESTGIGCLNKPFNIGELLATVEEKLAVVYA